MPPLTRRLATVAAAAGLLTGMPAGSAGAQVRAVARSSDAAPGRCGATVADYVGTDDRDTAFTGTIDAGGTTRPFWLVPEGTTGDVRAWIYDADTDTWTDSASAATVGENYRGNPTVWFSTPYGHAESDEVSCQDTADSPTRVLHIDGTVLHSHDHLDFFTLTRS